TVVLSKLIKRKRSVFGPPIGKHCLVFIDDMNMPAKEIYGAQPPLELLRMYFDHGYWFDLKDMNKIFVEDLFFVAAMGPAGGSRQEVYARFLRHFCLLSINLFPEPSMTKIYSTLLVEAMR
ncbi:dynein heavy chain 12, axonemal-like, partial [Nilaparvata lugens]